MKTIPTMNAAFAAAARQYSKEQGVPLQQAMIELAKRDPKAYARQTDFTDEDMRIRDITAEANAGVDQDNAMYEQVKAKLKASLLAEGWSEKTATALIARYWVAPQTLTDRERAAIDAIKIHDNGPPTNKSQRGGSGGAAKPAKPSGPAPVAGIPSSSKMSGSKPRVFKFHRFGESVPELEMTAEEYAQCFRPHLTLEEATRMLASAKKG